MPGVAVQALAKVNLGLRVLYQRRDGYRELRTVFQTISLADRIQLEYQRAGEARVELTCNRADLEGADNLASRAAARLLQATGSGGRVRIRLEKQIPVGAGLGGGSSDAAAVLWALAALLRPRPGRELLRRLAAELGSDVPFFLLGGRALGLGRGSELYPLPDGPPRWVLVVAPPFAVSTAEAYRRLSPDLTSGGWNDKIDRFSSDVCASEQALETERTAGTENDFESVVFRMYPELETLKARLQQRGACPALLCGSGSAVFGMFADRRQALRARDSLAPQAASRWLVKTVGRNGYYARWRRWLGKGRTL